MDYIAPENLIKKHLEVEETQNMSLNSWHYSDQFTFNNGDIDKFLIFIYHTYLLIVQIVKFLKSTNSN